MVSVFVFGLPISKAFNKNDAFTSINTLHQYENENFIKTYAIHDVTPEMIWEYNGKLKNIYKNNKLKLPSEDTFGLLVPEEDFDKISTELNTNFNLKFIKTYNLNVGTKQKNRLIRQFYLVSKK